MSAVFLSVRKHLFCSSIYLSAVVLADFVLLYFSSPVGLALLSFLLYTHLPTLVGSLPWFFTVRVLVSSRHPSRSSLLASSASPGSQQRLFIAFSPPLCPAGSAEAGLCSARRGSEPLAIGECQLVDFWDWVFGFRCINTFYFSPAIGFRSRSWQHRVWNSYIGMNYQVYPSVVTKHWLPIKIFSPRTWKTANRVSCTFKRENVVNIPFPFSRSSQHTTKTAQIMVFSILHHRSLIFVNATNEDAAVGRFRIPTAGVNATRKMARGKNWFTRNDPAC